MRRGKERSAEMKRKLNSPEIRKWWREAEELLYSPSFLPEYPLSEKLPLEGDPITIWPEQTITEDDYDAMVEFGSMVGAIVNGHADIGLDSHETEFVKLYWSDGIPIEDIKDVIGIPMASIPAYAKELKERIIAIKRNGTLYCLVCHKTKLKGEFASTLLCKSCSEKDWES